MSLHVSDSLLALVKFFFTSLISISKNIVPSRNFIFNYINWIFIYDRQILIYATRAVAKLEFTVVRCTHSYSLRSQLQRNLCSCRQSLQLKEKSTANDSLQLWSVAEQLSACRQLFAEQTTILIYPPQADKLEFTIKKGVLV